MSAYTKWNVPALRDECESRGLIYDGLRKKDLIDLLRRDDDEAGMMTPRFDPGHRFGVGHANASQFKPKFTPRLTDTRFRHAGVNNGIYAPRPAMQRMAWRPQGPAHIPVQRPAAKICWTCSSGGHTSKNCPQRNFCAPQCVLCGKVHNANAPCPVGGQNAAYSVCDNNSRSTFDFE